MSEPMSPLDPDLAKLLDAEKSPPAPAGKERVHARLVETLFVPPGGGGGGSGGGGLPLARALAIFGVGAAVGGAVVAIALAREPRIVYVDRPIAAPSSSSVIEIVEAPSVSAPIPTLSVSTAKTATATPPPPSASSGASLAAERALLDPARTALARGDASSALDGISRHERAFPNGALTEEREALAVQALGAARRMDEARARGQRFKKRWPQSVFVPVIDATLGEGQ